MISGQGTTLGGVGLKKGFIQVTTGTFRGATTFHCHADGNLLVKFEGVDAPVSYPWVVGDAFPIVCESITVSTGTFSIGHD